MQSHLYKGSKPSLEFYDTLLIDKFHPSLIRKLIYYAGRMLNLISCIMYE
jgi:hypothetical protein